MKHIELGKCKHVVEHEYLHEMQNPDSDDPNDTIPKLHVGCFANGKINQLIIVFNQYDVDVAKNDMLCREHDVGNISELSIAAKANAIKYEKGYTRHRIVKMR
jgi:hypothetical protein